MGNNPLIECEELEVSQTVVIQGADELPTPCTGKGTVVRQIKRYPEFYVVLVWNRKETTVFHKSQLLTIKYP